MKKLLSTLVTALLLLCIVGTANALIIFQDDFNSENAGTGSLNYSTFTNWGVTDGTVDLIGNGYYDFQPGYGLYVDMDGSTGDAGKMLSSVALNLAAGSYKLSFELAGNHRNGSVEMTSVAVELGIFSDNYSLNQNAGFQLFEEYFTIANLTSVVLKFEGVGSDNIGMLLDNVKLETAPVPEPATMMLFGIGLLGLAGVSRRRK